jgi:hypothetical protein
MAGQRQDTEEQRIRSRIERRRARMGAAIEEVGAHLNPDHLKDEFRTGVREQVEQTKREIRGATIGRAETFINDMEDTVNRTRRTLMETIRDNPVPAAMAGIGLGWLVVDARRHDSDDDYDGYAVGGRYDRDHYGRYGGEYRSGRSDLRSPRRREHRAGVRGTVRTHRAPDVRRRDARRGHARRRFR